MDNVIYLTEDFEPVSKDDPRMVMVKVRMPDGRVVFGVPEQATQNKLFVQGGVGSGHTGHAGRPGRVGGSAPGKGRPGFVGGSGKGTGGSMNSLAGSIVYRSTTSTRKEGLPGKHFAVKEEIAKQYGKNIEVYKISDDANIVDFSSEEAQPITELWGNAPDNEIRDKAKELGIHGINYDFDPSGKFGIVIFDETKIKKIK